MATQLQEVDKDTFRRRFPRVAWHRPFAGILFGCQKFCRAALNFVTLHSLPMRCATTVPCSCRSTSLGRLQARTNCVSSHRPSIASPPVQSTHLGPTLDRISSQRPAAKLNCMCASSSPVPAEEVQLVGLFTAAYCELLFEDTQRYCYTPSIRHACRTTKTSTLTKRFGSIWTLQTRRPRDAQMAGVRLGVSGTFAESHRWRFQPKTGRPDSLS